MFYERITAELSGLVTRTWNSFDMLVLDIKREQLLPVVQRLKADFRFDLFLDVTAIDHLPREPRFEVVYHFLCTAQHRRIRLKLPVSEADPTVGTLTGLYGSARFMEREAHEMYGADGNHGQHGLRARRRSLDARRQLHQEIRP